MAIFIIYGIIAYVVISLFIKVYLPSVGHKYKERDIVAEEEAKRPQLWLDRSNVKHEEQD